MKLGQPLPQAAGADILEVVRLSKPGGSGWHSHRDAQWVSAGSGLIAVETEEARWFALPGQALLIASNVPHDLRWYGASSVITAYLPPNTVRSDKETACCRSNVSPLLEASVRIILERSAGGNAAGESLAHLYDLVLSEMRSDEIPALSLASPVSRTLRTLCMQLRDLPSGPVDLDTCASSAGMSRRTFTRRFQKETQLTFHQWVRVFRALQALQRGFEGAKPKEICQCCGYGSEKHMHAEIRSLFGMPLRELVN